MAAKQSTTQKETVSRVMHEFKHGELRMRGDGPKVRSARQAKAIALHEAGASRDQSPDKRRRALKRSKRQEGAGKTALAESEGRQAQSWVMRRATKSRGAHAPSGGAAGSDAEHGPSKSALYAEARARGIAGRSRMSKAELARALGH
ncbi:DUF6496 domain-containing protein [Acidisoma sp. C75]